MTDFNIQDFFKNVLNIPHIDDMDFKGFKLNITAWPGPPCSYSKTYPFWYLMLKNKIMYDFEAKFNPHMELTNE